MVSELEAAAAAIRRAGGNVDILELDVLDVEAVRSAFSARPSYDILVNNAGTNRPIPFLNRSEEPTSELQSIMHISYAEFCLKNKKNQKNHVLIIQHSSKGNHIHRER